MDTATVAGRLDPCIGGAYRPTKTSRDGAGAIAEPVLPAAVIATLAISLRRLRRPGGW